MVKKKIKKTEQSEGVAEEFEEKLKKHFEEPLFVVAIASVLLAVIKPLFNLDILTYGILLLGLISVYFVYIYFKNDVKNYYFIGIPVLILLITLFSYYADQGAARDFTAFSIMFAVFLLFYSLWMHKIIKELRHALIAAIFICAMLTHLMGAFSDDLAALDPYYFYKLSNYIMDTGNVMEHDHLVYPFDGRDITRTRSMAAVFMASVTNVLSPLGVDLHDAAILYPGVVSAFVVLVLYLLMRDLFSDMKPYNYIAALLAAFMLMLTPGFAEKAIATNCEDDALGMFLMVSSFFLMTLGFRKRNLKITLLAGFSFLMLAVTWGGYMYAAPVVGVFIILYALMNFIHKKNTVKELPYFVIPVLITFLSPLILHARGELPASVIPPMLVLVSIGGAFLFAVILEIIRGYMYGKITIPEKTIEDKMENLIDKYILPIGVAGVILGIIFALTFPVFSYMLSVIGGVEVKHIIGLTIAEQIRQVYTIDQAFNFSVGKYGISVVVSSILVLLPLCYLTLVKRSMGAAFILAWSVPMIMGIISKPQYGFVASAPLVALAATLGLLTAVNKKDFESWRIIATILLIVLVPLTYIPLAGASGGFFGYSNSYMTSNEVLYSGSRTMIGPWLPTLKWLGEQEIDGSTTDWSTITWWDYGHWITSISKRVSIADNIQDRRDIIQDDAKFHVLVRTEEEALEIARKYSGQYVAIDWTMIGKSHAPHFIATSDVTTNDCGFDLGYGQLGFNPAFRYGSNPADVCDSTREELRPDGQGGVESTKCLGFIGGPHIGAVLFYIKNNAQISSIYVVTPTGDKILWETWRDTHNVSILGVQPFYSSTSPSIISTARYITDEVKKGNRAPSVMPTYRTLIYVPNEIDDGKSNRPKACASAGKYNTEYLGFPYNNFNDYMLTKLYLGDYADTYYNAGLCTTSWCRKAAEEGPKNRLKYFKIVDEFDGVGEPDHSYLGYVRVYEIIYPEEIEEEENEETTGTALTLPEEGDSDFITWG